MNFFKDQGKLMCEIFGQGKASLFELCMAIEMVSVYQMMLNLEPKVPEIEVTCSLDYEETAMIAEVRASLEKKYQEALVYVFVQKLKEQEILSLTLFFVCF